MATAISVSNLTLNPKEVGSFGKFIQQLVFEKPELRSLHQVFSDIKMKEQIVLAGKVGLMGKKNSGTCERQSSGAKVTLSQKYWEPIMIEDTITNCQAEVNSLFKAYFDQIMEYRDRFDITGSDEFIFLAKEVEDAAVDLIYRSIWFGDTDIAASTASTAGLKDGDNAYAFNYFDGFWKQIFDGVLAGSITPVDITALQASETVSAANAYATILNVYKKSSAKVRANKDAKFYVDGQMFLGLMEYMQTESVNFTLDITENGIQTLKFLGHEVVDMSFCWDENLQYFEADSTGHEAFLPHRVIFTVKENLAVGTENGEEFTNLESWYNQDERVNKIAFGFTLDAKILMNDLIVVAY